MDAARAARLTGAALACYPARWQARHGDEAAELAALLIRDGKPAGTVALSYLAGAARERLTHRPGRRRGAAACALLAAACLLGLTAGLLASAGPARAAATAHVHCRPPAGPPAAVLPAPGHPPLVTGEAGHGRGC
jgi:hypothetical protein